MSKKITILLLIIVIVGGFLRFWSLGENALGFFRDEAALGFNTQLVLKTGADEYGQKFPIFFRSFEVFFMPAYVYLSVPFVAILGVNEFSTRFLSALSGIVLIIISFLIVRQIFSSERVGILSSAVVAFSPWSIFYSRGAFEGNLALVFFAVGIFFWIEFLKSEKKKFFILSIILFVISMYSYQAPRIVVPLFIAAMILSKAGWQKNLKLWFFGLGLAAILYLPVIILSSQVASYHRGLGVSLFSSTQQIPGFATSLGDWQKLYLIPREFLSLYLHYFSPYNLFWEGDYNRQRNIEGFSIFYFWQLPFLLLGAWIFFKNNFSGKKLLLIWLLLAPIPASMTKDPFHTYRALLIFLPLSFLIALGFEKVINIKRSFSMIAIFGFLSLTIISLITYFFSLQVSTPSSRWRDWDFGYRQIADFLKTQPEDLRIIIDDPNTESYIHMLFYGVVPVYDYQKAASELITNKYYSSSEMLRPAKIGRFEFRKVDFPNERGSKDTIFILSSKVIEPIHFRNDPKLKLERSILAPNGETAFYIIKVV